MMRRFYIVFYYSGNKHYDIPKIIHDTNAGIDVNMENLDLIGSFKEVAAYTISNLYNVEESEISYKDIAILNFFDLGEYTK
jgi:hypothetical protein